MDNRKPPHRPKGTPKTGGRKKGTPNKTTTEIAQACRAIVTDERYRKQFNTRARAGKLAPAVECMVWHYAFGKPKDTTILENPDGSAVAPLVMFYLPDNGRNAH